jgi:hypothetical protein
MIDTKKQGRSLPWFRVDNDMVDHPKVDALADRLKDPNALAYVVRLWAWTMRYAARGRLAGGAGTARAGSVDGARLSVERACAWRGPAGELWSALVDTGWIDVAPDGSAEVHDWDEHQGAAVAKAEKDANRKRDDRKRRADGAGRSTDAGADGRADGAGNETERDGTERDDRGSMSSPLLPDRVGGAVEDKNTRWLQEAEGFIAWARAQAPQLNDPGPKVREWARVFFLKYQPADPELPRVAFAKFLIWCHQAGKTVGWGLWLSEAVHEPRWAEARAEAQARGAA